jgi:transcriptional regulator with XRE-family HTH domain
MSMTRTALLPPSIATEMRQFWGRMFGDGIRAHREHVGISIEEAAGLSGMDISEWMAIEDGYVPQDVNRLRAMAAAIEMRYENMASMAFLCQGAWAS